MSKEKKLSHYFVSTPIYYANGLPHIGSAYTTILADFLKRYYNEEGAETFFLTGTDEHGDKVQRAAEELNKSPKKFTDEVSSKFKEGWDELGIVYDKFIRTTDSEHIDYVNSVLQKIFDKGDIYFGEYGGNYCYGCERFLTDKEVVDGKCPDHETEVEHLSEKNYFFKLSKYQEQLLEHINKNPDFIRPERYKNELLGLLREPLEDLCISRPKSRLTWGIELPFDSEYVTYVWFDALVNYLSAINYPEGKNSKELWANSEHLIGKDILKPHGVFWPSMLLAAEVPLFKNLSVHGYWVSNDSKISKSLGNAISPFEIKEKFGIDALRYFLLREMTFGLDGNFSSEIFEARYNADLANNLGNLISRSFKMCERFRESAAPDISKISLSKESLEIKELGESLSQQISLHVEERQFQKALAFIWKVIDALNIYIDRSKPWALAKDETKKELLDEVLYVQLDTIRIVAGCLQPFMPDTSSKILKNLGIEKPLSLSEKSSFGLLKAGQKLEKVEILFPRYETNKKEKTMSEASPKIVEDNAKIKTESKTEKKNEGGNLINFTDFQKVDLKVGQIMEAEKIEGADKLLKLQVELGEENKRQIVAGIAAHFEPENLIGRKVSVVCNLKPAKLRGVKSEGMVLATSSPDGTLTLLTPDAEMPAGTKIS